MTPFNALPGDILTTVQKARSFAFGCDGPVSVLIGVNQRPGLPLYVFHKTFMEVPKKTRPAEGKRN